MHVLQPKSLIGLIGACIALYVVYYVAERVITTIYERRRYHDVPSLPRHWLLGNLMQMGEKLGPHMERHPDYGMTEIWEELGQPGAFLMDIQPIDKSIVVIADPAIAEQIVQPSSHNKYSIPKSDTVSQLWRLTGKESMLTKEGEEWKPLRKRFNKGFSPAHLHTLCPLVVSKTRIFVDRLRAAAKTGEVFTLKEYSQDLATDIITTIAVEKDFGSQSIPAGQGAKSRFGFLTASRKLPGLTYKTGQGFNPLYFLDPIRPAQEWFYDRIQNRILDDLIRESLKRDQERDASEKKTSSGKAIVQLALSGLRPTDQLIANTRDQIKTFLFAGTDTTATTIQWACYEMSKANHSSRHATFLAKLRAEHDSVFGSSSYFSALSALSDIASAEHILGDKLPYTTAFIKEVLRLHPPAGSARRSVEDPKHEPPLTIDIDGRPTRIDGLRIYSCHWIIHHSPKVWGPDAAEFNPDRWLDEPYMKNLPVGAWRPFERGPRNCIGQELAIMEMKVVICAVARGCVFEKVGQTGRDGEKEVFSVHEVTAVPSDGMRVRVQLRGEQEEEVQREE